MIAALATLALLGGRPALAHGPVGPADRGQVPEFRGKDGQVAMAALTALGQEDADRARELLAPYEPYARGSQGIRFAGGVLRFFEQRYQEAIELMESSGAGALGGYLPLARAAREITEGDARFEGEHFVVSYPKGKDEVLVPYLVDTLEKQRAALGDGLGTTPRVKVTVEIVSDVRQLAQLSTLTEDEVRTTGTVAVSKFGKLMMLSPKALLKGYDWLDTAAHEFTHYVITERTHNRAPLWMQEGLAKWFEQGWRGRHEPVTPFSAALVRDAIARKDLVTFEEMHPSLAKLPTQERAALAYAEVSMAIEWLVKQKGPASLERMTGLLGDGKSTEEAVSQAAGEPFKRFLDDWNRYMAQRPMPRGGDRELKKLRFKDDPKQGTQFAEWSEIPDEDSRGYARLGEIFRARGRWAAARLEYAKAYDKVGARIPILSGRYALAAIMSGDKTGAEKVLSEALAWNPDYPALNVQMARLLIDRGQLQAARDHLLAANRQDPFDPEIHAGLAKVLGAMGDPGGAERETRFTKLLVGQETPP
jgi:tetratricopeptide (TPR) repeat protein